MAPKYLQPFSKIQLKKIKKKLKILHIEEVQQPSIKAFPVYQTDAWKKTSSGRLKLLFRSRQLNPRTPRYDEKKFFFFFLNMVMTPGF